MKHSSIMVSDTLDRVSAFFATTPPWTAAIPAPANVATQLAAVDNARAVLQTQSTNQLSGQNTSRHQAAVTQSLRKLLRADHLMPIRRIARAMLADQAGVANQFNLPSVRTNTKRLVAAAQQVAQDVVPYQSVMVANGRPADFLDQLQSTTTALTTAAQAQETGSSIRSNASTGIMETLRKGRQAVHYLDAIMQSCFGNSPEIMAQWRQAKRVRKSTSSVAGGAAPVSPSVSAAAGTAVTGQAANAGVTHSTAVGQTAPVSPAGSGTVDTAAAKSQS